MKKILMLLVAVCLCACDKKTSEADLLCSLDKNWQTTVGMFITDGKINYVDVNVKIVTYDDYAEVTVNNVSSRFEKIIEHLKDGMVSIEYKGNFPDSERTAILSIYADIINNKILQYDIMFDGQYILKESSKVLRLSSNCIPVNEEYKGELWQANVPFNYNYKVPNKVEKCIIDICKKVACVNQECNQLILYNGYGKFIRLSQEQALGLSKNWNYTDMKLYQNDGKLEDYEKDACDVVDRLNKFMSDNGLKRDETVK